MMRNYKFNVVLLCIAASISIAKSQTFQEFNPEFSRAEMLVDEGLFLQTDATLQVNGQKWPIVYACGITEAQPLYKNGSIIMRRSSDKKTGKTSQYVVYTEPYVYYGILDLPDGSGRFYGIFTTGYDTLNDIVSLPKSQWHPYTDVIVLSGKIVNTDGTTEPYLIKSLSDLKANGLTKPLGTYWCRDKLGYSNMKLDFKAGGTGTITCVHPKASWILMSLGGSSNYKDKGTGKWKSHTSVTGGYKVWMRPTVTRPFKWSISEDGDIKIIPSGTSSVELKEGIDFDDNNQYYSSEADRKLHMNQQKSDFKTNAEAASARKFFRAMAANHIETIDEISLQPLVLTNKEMMSVVTVKASDKKDLDYDSFSKDPEDAMSYMQWDMAMPLPTPRPFLSYFSSNQVETDKYGLTMDLPTLLYEDVDDYLALAKKVKPDGGKFGYDKMVDETRKFMREFNLPEGCDYLVTDINPIERKAKMAFTEEDIIYFCDLFFEDDYSLNAKKTSDTLHVSNVVADNAEKISSQNELILSHKKDKSWKESIKLYEKELKKAKADKLESHFKTVEEYFKIVNKQEDILKIQESILKGKSDSL